MSIVLENLSEELRRTYGQVEKMKEEGDGEEKAIRVSGNVWVKDGCYCVQKYRKVEVRNEDDSEEDDSNEWGDDEDKATEKRAYYVPFANYTLRSLCLVKATDPKRLIEILGGEGQGNRVVEARMTDMNSPMAFYTLMESQGNFVCNLPSGALFNIKRSIFKNEIVADLVDVTGHHENGKVFVFGNGVLNYADGKFYPANKYGICKVGNDHYYIPAFSLTNTERLLHKSMQDYYYEPGGAPFIDLAKAFYEVYGDAGRVGIAFALSALFSDIIFEACGNFPLLFAYGVKGSGKTSYAEMLAAIFRRNATATNIERGGSTSTGLNRLLGQTRNGMEPLDEFKVDADRRMIGFVKAIYNRIGRVTGQYSNNKDTKVDEILSAVVVCGEHMPENNAALFSRLIQLNFFSSSYTEKQKDAFDRLADMLANNNGAAIVEALQYRKLFEDGYKDAFRSTRADLRADSRTHELSDRDLQKLSQIAATLRLVEGTGLIPDEVDHTISFMIEAIANQGKIIESTNEVSAFWKIFSELADEGEFEIPDGDEADSRPPYYEIDTTKDLIILNLNPVMGMVRERAIRRDYASIRNMPMNTLSDYLKKSAAYMPNETKDGRYHMRGNKKGHGFKYSAIRVIIGESSEKKTSNEDHNSDKDKIPF